MFKFGALLSGCSRFDYAGVLFLFLGGLGWWYCDGLVVCLMVAVFGFYSYLLLWRCGCGLLREIRFDFLWFTCLVVACVWVLCFAV